MAKRQKVSVDIVDNGDGTATLTVGPFGQTVPIAELLDRSQDLDIVRMNLVANWQLGAFGSPQSREFIDSVNGAAQNGIEGPDGRYKILSIDPTGPDSWHVEFKVVKLGTQYGFDVTLAQLNDLDDVDGLTRVRSNLRPFLRLNGQTTLSAAAIAQIKAARFVV